MNTLELTNYFINKFEAIPKEEWTTGAFKPARFGRNEQHCAMGHCSPFHSITGSPTMQYGESERERLMFLFLTCLQIHVAYVNDGLEKQYLQKDPKRRVLAALRDIRDIEQYRHMGIEAPKATDIEVQSASSKIKARFAKVFKSLASW